MFWFTAICGGFQKLVYCGGSATSVVVFHKLICEVPVLSAIGPVIHKLACEVVQRHLWWFFTSLLFQRHLWWFSTSLSVQWFSAICGVFLQVNYFSAICGGFSQACLCSGSAPSVVVFHKLVVQWFSAICGGFSQVYLSNGSAPSVVVFHKLVCAGALREMDRPARSDMSCWMAWI